MPLAAAVCPSAWNVVPLAVFFPSKRRPYQLAFPRNILARTLGLARSALWCAFAPTRWPDDVPASELDSLGDDAWGASRPTSKRSQIQMKLFMSPRLIRFPSPIRCCRPASRMTRCTASRKEILRDNYRPNPFVSIVNRRICIRMVRFCRST